MDPERLGERALAAAHLLDSEVTNAQRRLVLQGSLTGATALLTTDARLARAAGIRCTVEVL